jgi:monofunctional biosynthetic peptidoglycan transglycosylase
MAKRSLLVRLLRLLAFLAMAWVLVTVVLVLALRWLNPPTSAFILSDRIGVATAAKPTYRVRHTWTSWERIAGPMKVAVIAAEDQTFPAHNGFDFKSIDQALEERERGRRVRGASTISQQVAKNLFLWNGRNWIRKGLEAYFTVLIEVMWPKQRILEVYLNVAEFGRGVYGVGAASEAFFRKKPARLSSADAALLAAVLPNPKRLRADSPSRYVRSRQRWIMGQMRGLGGAALIEQLDPSSSSGRSAQ